MRPNQGQVCETAVGGDIQYKFSLLLMARLVKHLSFLLWVLISEKICKSIISTYRLIQEASTTPLEAIG